MEHQTFAASTPEQETIKISITGKLTKDYFGNMELVSAACNTDNALINKTDLL
jgi:hypothetical protein